MTDHSNGGLLGPNGREVASLTNKPSPASSPFEGEGPPPFAQAASTLVGLRSTPCAKQVPLERGFPYQSHDPRTEGPRRIPMLPLVINRTLSLNSKYFTSFGLSVLFLSTETLGPERKRLRK